MQIERIARRALAGLFFTTIAAAAAEARALCGDGTLDQGELCDDGNSTTGDGCNVNCQPEAGYECTRDPQKPALPSLCCFSEASRAYELAGNASLNDQTGEITLVPELLQQVGVAWFRQTLDFTRPFRVSLRLYLGTRDEAPTGNAQDDGADGGSILFQRDPRKLMARGRPGAELGAEQVSPVFGVEFDTYNNGASYNDLTTGDEDHVSVFHTRTTPASNHWSGAPVCLNEGSVCQNYEDGRYHAFAVEWTGNMPPPNGQQIRVYVDGKKRIELTRDVVAEIFNGDPTGIYFGFAASTGSKFNLHKFCPAAPEGFMVPRDRDRDGVDDSIDLDDDGDGRPDLDETAPVFGTTDPSEDRDNDGTRNFEDPDFWRDVLMRPNDCPDVAAPFGQCDSLPREVDRDGDRVPDHLDLDSDGDGVFDVIEDGNVDLTTTPVPPATMAMPPPDGMLDDCMVNPANGLCAGTRPPVPDANGDGIVDSRDPCVPNMMAAACMSGGGACTLDPNSIACGLEAPAGDRDGDTVPNATECPSMQSCPDTDGDGSRDFNDTDSDDDGTPDRVDPERLDPCVPDPRVARCARGDYDQDGASNGAECPAPPTCVDSNNDGIPDYQDPDQDDDETYDGNDPEPRNPCVPNPSALSCTAGDADRDGFVGPADPDPRNPCVPDANVVACATGDADGDGLTNGTECPNIDACPDTDGDGMQDWEDLDSNNDNVNDGERPELAGGACSAAGTRGAGLGLLLPVLFATWLGRGWRRRRTR